MNFFTLLMIILVVVVLWAAMTYNRFIHQIEAIRNNKKQIDIQLDRRFKVFESLINVVKKYMDYEKTTLKEVISLRTNAQAAQAKGDEKSRMVSEEGISKIASQLNLVFEQYPTLKADQNALQLQEEIVNTENKLTFSKQAFNDSIEKYNASKRSFPAAIIVNTFKQALDQSFIYWGLEEGKVKEQENYTVKL